MKSSPIWVPGASIPLITKSYLSSHLLSFSCPPSDQGTTDNSACDFNRTVIPVPYIFTWVSHSNIAFPPPEFGLSPCLLAAFWLSQKVGNVTAPPFQLPAVPGCNLLFVALTSQTCFQRLCRCYRKFRGDLEVDAAWLSWQCQLLLPSQ